jgi:hypothetical protein
MRVELFLRRDSLHEHQAAGLATDQSLLFIIALQWFQFAGTAGDTIFMGVHGLSWRSKVVRWWVLKKVRCSAVNGLIVPGLE